jgi:hypothetical protein
MQKRLATGPGVPLALRSCQPHRPAQWANRMVQYTGPEGTLQYSYDNLGQLIGVSGARQETYVYDANGNRLYAASPALPNGEAHYTIGPENRLLSDGTYRYEYDTEGNLIRKTRISDGQVTEFTYDYRNRVTDIVVKGAQGNVVYRTHYIYDVFDRRIATEVDADGDGPQQPVRTWTFYDGDNPIYRPG